MDYEALKNDHFVSFQLDPNDKEYQEVEKEFCRSMHPKDTNVSGMNRPWSKIEKIERIQNPAEYLGLDLNRSKTELICAEQAGKKILDAAPTLCKVPPEQAVILGLARETQLIPPLPTRHRP